MGKRSFYTTSLQLLAVFPQTLDDTYQNPLTAQFSCCLFLASQLYKVSVFRSIDKSGRMIRVQSDFILRRALMLVSSGRRKAERTKEVLAEQQTTKLPLKEYQ